MMHALHGTDAAGEIAFVPAASCRVMCLLHAVAMNSAACWYPTLLVPLCCTCSALYFLLNLARENEHKCINQNRVTDKLQSFGRCAPKTPTSLFN